MLENSEFVYPFDGSLHMHAKFGNGFSFNVFLRRELIA